MSLIGSSLCSLLALILPGLFHLVLHRRFMRKTRPEHWEGLAFQAADLFLIAFGAVFGVLLGLSGALGALFGSSGRLPEHPWTALSRGFQRLRVLPEASRV